MNTYESQNHEQRNVHFCGLHLNTSNVHMYILCDLKGQYLKHAHVAHVYEYMGAECLRQRMHAIFALSRAVAIATRSRDLLRDHVTCHVIFT